VVVAINASQDGTINAVDVFSWSKNDLVNVKIRDAILDIGVLDDTGVPKLSNAITSVIRADYVPRDIEEFQYLEANIAPPEWIVWFLWIFGLAFPFVWGYISHKHLDVR
jgi:hypothetical protein